MKSCTFFGHRHCPEEIADEIRRTVTMLINEHGVDRFYLGNQGDFDKMALNILRELKQIYPHINYSVVLAYHPTERNTDGLSPDETVFPEEMEEVYPRFAIDKRNRYMINKCDCVISYALINGGAMKFTELARKSGKAVYSIDN